MTAAKRIIIINPPFPRGDIVKARPRQPLGLAYIASVLRRSGHMVSLVDMNINKLEIEELGVEGFDFAVITTSPMDRWETPFIDYSNALRVAEKCKQAKLFAILTGPHATTTPELVLGECEAIDFLILGEAEEAIRELVASPGEYKNIKGIAYRESGEVRINPKRELIKDLGSLPIPAYDLLPMEKYQFHNNCLPGKFTIMETSRGCPFDCQFCYKAMQGGQVYRARSVDSVIAEIEYLINSYGIESIYFQDLEFTIQKERVRKICKSLIDKKIKINWGCAARVDQVDSELLKLMKEAGCTTISYGIESLSETILKTINKKITLDNIKSAWEGCNQAGIFFNQFYTQGHPGENSQTLTESFKNAWRIRFPHPLQRYDVIPYPGTRLYELAKENKQVKIGSWEEARKLQGRVGIGEKPKMSLVAWFYYLLLYLFVNRKYKRAGCAN